MREIKFRGFNRKNNVWLYGFYLQNRKAHFVAPDEFATDKSWDDYEADPETVGQFTGLKDKNGKEIWEGDVVDLYLYPGKYTVEYHGCSFCIRDMRDNCLMGLDDYDEDSIIVIGNIHDNPELLKED